MQRLAETKGLSEAKVEKILEAAKKMCTSYGWQTATQVQGHFLCLRHQLLSSPHAVSEPHTSAG